MSASLLDEIKRLNSNLAKQRNEIGRLTREVEQLKADKSALRFDLNKERAGARLLRVLP